MQLSLPCFTAHTKSLPSSRPTASVKDWADSLWKPQPHYRFYFISPFFGWRAVGISNPARKESSIPCLPVSAWALGRSRSSFSFKRAGRSLLFRPFLLAAPRSWRSRAFCFSTKRRRGSGLPELRLQSQDCFYCANKTALRARDSHHAIVEY